MNRLIRAEEFYKTIILNSRNSKTTLSSSKTNKIDANKSVSLIKSFSGGMSDSCVLDHKNNSSPSHPHNTNEATKKYEQDLQLAYYSELEEFTNTLFKKGILHTKTHSLTPN